MPTAGLRRWWPSAGLILLTLLAMGGSLRNGWVQDDPLLIERNATVHQWSGLVSGFAEAYWPPPSTGGLYRPLARSFHTLQWMATGGALLTFRLVDLLLYLGLVLAVWALARELLGPTQAWVAAALFAVHPVHVEAVAVAVNQGEVVVAIAASLLGVAWLRWARGGSDPRRTAWITSATLLVALGFKENALILPLLLAALEVTVLREATKDRRQRWVLIVGVLVVGAAWWMLRTRVLGDLAGAAPAEGLKGADLGGRTLTMLGVVVEWARLLLWPAHLRADYSPWEIAPYSAWGVAQTGGLLIFATTLFALVRTWRSRPRIAFALLWIAVAIAPVSNLMIPTGILLAERTLLLASVGVVLLLGAMVPNSFETHPRLRLPAGAALAALLALGAGRSAVRMPIYHDRASYLAAMAHDSPKSWRTMVALGIDAMESGRREEGERSLRAASAVWPAAPRPYQLLAFYDRLDGRCDSAVPLLERSLAIQPDDRWTRLPLVACLLDLGRYADAHTAAAADTAADLNGRALVAAVATADSALRVNAPAHSVRLPPVPGGVTMIGPQPPGQ